MTNFQSMLLSSAATSDAATSATILGPLAILAVGVAIVLGMILVLRLNAFFALITAALAVSLLAPGDLAIKAVRVADAFGVTAGKIGISIAMAAVIGSAMTASGAADRIVAAILRAFGQKRAPMALATSGFVLSVPVFFDTVFYLLCPLARSTYRRTGVHYLRYLLALGAGGTATHTLVPPTPGPLAAAENLQVDIGLMMLIGAAVGVPSTIAGLAFAAWVDRRLPLAAPPTFDEQDQLPHEHAVLPGLLLSLLPILLPVGLIAGHAIAMQADPAGFADGQLAWLAVAGNPNIALMLSAAVALLTYVLRRRPSRNDVTKMVEESLLSAGVIILITAAGGAFGAMLKDANVGDAVQAIFADKQGAAGIALLLLAFATASMMKLSQGSTTVAMITASGMIYAMISEVQTDGSVHYLELGYHRAYLASAVGCGAMVAAWMNDSGFWVFCRMGGLSESEGLRTWTPITSIMGFAGLAGTIVMAQLWPLV